MSATGPACEPCQRLPGMCGCKIPKLRRDAFFPPLLQRRRHLDQTLFAVAIEAYLQRVSTRKVDNLVKALEADSGISKSKVSRICADVDAEVGSFTVRKLDVMDLPHVLLDARYCKLG